jgi:hypothetical protein
LAPDARSSWYASILREIEEEELFDKMDRTRPWNSDGNRVVACTRIGVLNCPKSRRAAPTAVQPTNYIGIAGLGTDSPFMPKTDARAGVFGYDRTTTVADIKDGTSTTIMLAETGRVIGSWLQGGPATVRGLDPAQLPYIGPGCQFGGLHRRACIAMANGSVHWISDRIDAKVFEAMSTIAGGETIPADWYE